MIYTPIEIVVKDTGKTVGYACSKCEIFYSSLRYGGKIDTDRAFEQAQECCSMASCEKHGKDLKRYQGCDECSLEDRAAKEHARFCAAKRVTLAEYDGLFLYREGFGNDGYFPVSDVYDEAYEDDDGPITWAWACTEDRVEADDVTQSLDNTLDNHHDAASDFVDWDLVAKAEALLLEACKDVVSYTEDNSTVVLLGEAPVAGKDILT